MSTPIFQTLPQIEGALGYEVMLPTLRNSYRHGDAAGALRFRRDFNLEDAIRAVNSATFLSEEDKRSCSAKMPSGFEADLRQP